MKSNLSFLLLSTLASTAAANKGYDNIVKVWDAFNNAATDFQGFLDVYADDAIIEVQTKQVGSQYGFDHPFEGVNQIGKNGFSIEKLMGWVGGFDFFRFESENYAFPDDEIRAANYVTLCARVKSTGERHKLRYFNEYYFNENGQLQRTVQRLVSFEKIDAVSIYEKAVAGYKVGEASYWVDKFTDETVLKCEIPEKFEQYRVLAGTYTGKAGLMEYMTKAGQVSDPQLGQNGGFLVNARVLTSSADGKTVYAEQMYPETLKDGTPVFQRWTIIVTVTDKGDIASCESRMTDLDTYGSPSKHTEL